MLAAFEEVPGLYGALRIPEKLIQKIWLRGEFEKDALRTTDGGSIRVLSPGKWNLSGEGPDFLGAEIEIAGSTVLGDVEIHFRSSDWRAHGHHENPSFERVVLHVILFPLSDHENRNPAITLGGIRPPTLELLPVLHESLEEFVQRAVEQQSDDFRESVRAKEGNINVHSLHYRTDIPMFAVSTSLEEAEAGSAQAQLLSEQGYSAQAQPSAHSLSAGAGDLTDSSDVSTKAGLDTYIQKLEEKLNSVGDDAQLANVDLQNMLQKQQQTLQMMSNIGKMLHDTAMAIIRKIGG